MDWVILEITATWTQSFKHLHVLKETFLEEGRPVSEALKKLIDQIKEDIPQTTICPAEFKATLAKLNSLFVGTE